MNPLIGSARDRVNASIRANLLKCWIVRWSQRWRHAGTDRAVRRSVTCKMKNEKRWCIVTRQWWRGRTKTHKRYDRNKRDLWRKVIQWSVTDKHTSFIVRKVRLLSHRHARVTRFIFLIAVVESYAYNPQFVWKTIVIKSQALMLMPFGCSTSK